MGHSRQKRRWRADLGSMARQANHVVAAAVFVFVLSALLGFLLQSRVLIPVAGWIQRTWGATGILLLAPLVADGAKVLTLLAVAFPLGRVTAPRPWPTGTALVLLVYFFWFCLDYVTGNASVLYGHWRAVVGRGVLLALTLYLVVRLVAWGRRAALEVDRKGAQPDPEDDEPGDDDPTDSDSRAASPSDGDIKDSAGKSTEDRDDAKSVCKQAPMADVSGAEK